jgi:hypothetical protein
LKIISFAHTVPALLAGAKTCTRREWSDDYGSRFRAGELVSAFDRSPRIHGRRIGVVRLTEQPRREPLAMMPDTDYQAEGFEWMTRHPDTWPKSLWGEPFEPGCLTPEWFARCQSEDRSDWVIRFELVELDPEGFLAQRDSWREAVLADHSPAVARFYASLAVPV